MGTEETAAAQPNSEATAEVKQDTAAADASKAAAAADAKPDAAAQAAAESKEKAAAAAATAAATSEKKAEEKPAPPEKYDLKPPAGSQLSKAHLDKIASTAKEQGLSQDDAQKMVQRDHDILVEHGKEQLANLDKQSTAWKEELRNDKDFGGDKFEENAELSHRVLARFGDEAFVQELQKTGLGNHPGLMKAMNRIGRAMSEDQLKMPNSSSQIKAGKRSTEEILYDHKPAGATTN